MNIRTLCLAILYQGEATGYEIRKAAQDGHFRYFVEASFGSIYPALSKLEKDALVTMREEAQSGKPSRKVYSITELGRSTFEAAILTPRVDDIFKSEFLLLAMFAEVAGYDAVRTAIDRRLSWIAAEIDHLKDVAKSDDRASAQWACSYGLKMYEESLEFLIKNRKSLEEIAAKGLTLPSEAAE